MLKRYTLKSTRETHEGWAIFVLDTDIGFFSVCSDFGNYAYLWTHPGCEFRKFLCDINADYLRGKLLHGQIERQRVFDGEATEKAIREAIDEESPRNQATELALLEHRSLDSIIDFHDWLRETSLVNGYEHIRSKPDPECTAFCEKVFPRFKKILVDELAEEARSAPSSSTEIQTP